jgi:hypothetical protein
MTQTKMTFDQVVANLTAAKIPCNVKHYQYENGNTEYSVEFGFNWPEELVEAVDNAFGGMAPDYISLCAESCGPDVLAKARIAGGPQSYMGYNKW